MAYNEIAAERMRAALAGRRGITEKKMFGGVAFMLNGNMCCGIQQDDLMIRVGPHNHDPALKQPHARPMDFTGRPMIGYVYVAPGGYKTDAGLAGWIDLGADFAATLPAKKPGAKKPAKKK